MTRTILAVPGIERLNPKALDAFFSMCERHGWDADSLAAVLSSESGFYPHAGVYAWSPKRTASGLLQFIESTAKALGVQPTTVRPAAISPDKGAGKAWATWRILAMPQEEQIPLVEAFYVRGFGTRRPTRPVDYYLLPWGAWPGLAMDYVLAREGQRTYEENRGLDLNHDKTITVADLAARVASIQAQARGRRIAIPDPPGDNSGALLGALGAGLLWLAMKRVRR